MCISKYLCRELSRGVGVHHAGRQLLSDAAGRAGGVLCSEAMENKRSLILGMRYSDLGNFLTTYC